MEEDACFRCDRSKEEVKLIDAVYGNELVKICEECSLLEDIPLIRKPSSLQLHDLEKPASVRERLRRMAGLPSEKQDKETAKITRNIMESISIDKLRKPKDYKKVLEEKYELAKTRNRPVNLIDNFNWLIMMGRKKRKMDRKQLAEAIQEPETAIKMIENKDMPDDSSRIISKIEQYFGIKLRKESNDNEGNRVREAISSRINPVKEPALVLKFDKEIAKNITIDDLRKMKAEKEKVENVVWGRGKGNEVGGKAEEEYKELIDSEIEFEEEEVK